MTQCLQVEDRSNYQVTFIKGFRVIATKYVEENMKGSVILVVALFEPLRVQYSRNLDEQRERRV